MTGLRVEPEALPTAVLRDEGSRRVECEDRGVIEVRGKGPMRVWNVVRAKTKVTL